MDTLDETGVYTGMVTHFWGQRDPRDTLKIRGGFKGEFDIEATFTSGRSPGIRNLPDFHSAAAEGILLFSQPINRSFYPLLAEALLQRLQVEAGANGWGFGKYFLEYTAWHNLTDQERYTGAVVRYATRPTMGHQPQNSMRFSFTQLSALRDGGSASQHQAGVNAVSAVLASPKALFAKALEILKINAAPTFGAQELIFMKPFTDWAVHQAPEHQDLLP